MGTRRRDHEDYLYSVHTPVHLLLPMMVRIFVLNYHFKAFIVSISIEVFSFHFSHLLQVWPSTVNLAIILFPLKDLMAEGKS